MNRPTLFALIVFCAACVFAGSKAKATAIFECSWSGSVQDVVIAGDEIAHHILITQRGIDDFVECPMVGDALVDHRKVGDLSLPVGTQVNGASIVINGDLRAIVPDQPFPKTTYLLTVAQ